MIARPRRVLAVPLSAALVALSPGLETPRLLAQVVRAPSLPGGAVAGASAAAGTAAAIPSLAAPATPLSPALSAPASGAAPSVPDLAAALAPHLAAAAAPASPTAAFAAGRGIEDVLTGSRSAGAGDAVAAAPGPDAPASALAAPATPGDGKGELASASAAARVQARGRAAGRVRRLLARMIEVLAGMPEDGPVTARNLPGRYALAVDAPDAMDFAVELAIRSDGTYSTRMGFQGTFDAAFDLSGRWTLEKGTFVGLNPARAGEQRTEIDLTGITRRDLAYGRARVTMTTSQGGAKASYPYRMSEEPTRPSPEVLVRALGGTLAVGRRGDLAEPAQTYAEALKKAVELAASRGASERDVRFVQATASMPVRDGAHWKYAFAAPAPAGKTGQTLIYVDFERFLGGPLEARASVYEGAPAPAQGKVVAKLGPSLFRMGTRSVSPQSALDLARRSLPSLGREVSVSLEYREEPVSGDKDLWYAFFDDVGPAASVNARTGEVRADRPAPGTLRASISRPSPIEGLTGFVYDHALAEARRMAAAAGRDPERLLVTGAKLAPRAWGEEWTFSFVSPRVGLAAWPRAYETTVRRTMVSETLVDVVGSRDLGAARLFAGAPAARFPELVKLDPMTVIERSGDDARALELQARWPSGGGDARLWYVIRGQKGRELKAVDAATGEEVAPRLWSRLAAGLARLVGIEGVLPR